MKTSAAQPLPREVSKGDIIRASDWNDLVRKMGALQSRLQRMDDAVAAAIAAMRPEWMIPCRILAVMPGDAATVAYYPDGGPPPGWDPAVDVGPPPPDAAPVRYTVEGIGRPEVRLENAAPVYGRPVKFNQARIYACDAGNEALNQAGKLCAILRGHDDEGAETAELIVFCETVAFGACPQ